MLGVDEAGRGAVLGPLVVAGVVLDSRKAGALTRRGVRDSKRFGSGSDARRRRRELAAHILRLAERVAVRVFEAAEVDRHAEAGWLNVLERQAAGEILEEVGPVDRVIADGARIFGPLAARRTRFEAVNDGEARHVAVAAASVLAKDRRDALFGKILAGYGGEFGEVRGGGYPNALTEEFVRTFYRKNGCFPPETRRSWDWRVLRELGRPRGLFESSASDDARSAAESR